MNDTSHTHDDVRYGYYEKYNTYSVSKTLLYEGSHLSKLSTTLIFINLKPIYGLSDKSFIFLMKYLIFFIF